MTITTPRIYEVEKIVHGNKAKAPFSMVPFTQIKNESGEFRKIADLTQNMKASLGVETVKFTSLSKVSKEFGPNGEIIWQLSNRDPRFRFWGAVSASSDSNGSRVTFNTFVEGFIEATFYGTGLNILTLISDAKDFRATIDGGGEGANLYPASPSSILSGRNYESNQVVKIVSGLSLDWHTVKIRITGANQIEFFGAQILNESNQIVINQGQPYVGALSAKITTQQLMNYKPSSLTGTKGGRVVIYNDGNGNLLQAVQAVDPSVTGNISATELITNGTFNSNVSSWISDNGGLSWNGSGYATQAYSTDYGSGQLITTEVGKTYKVTFKQINVPAVVNQVLAVEAHNGNYTGQFGAGPTRLAYSQTDSGFNGQVISFNFTAVSTSTRILWGSSGNTNPVSIDDISVKETSFNFLALSNSDHSLEEIIKKFSFRDFGRNRGDDFSTLTGSGGTSRTFVLGDGTTCLTSTGDGLYDTYGDGGGIDISASGYFWTLTFVGTGLDIISTINGTGTDPNPPKLYVDDVLVGTLGAVGATAGTIRKESLCSGLPYGTHKIKVAQEGGNLTVWSRYYREFIVYGAKKPSLPSNATEIVDYNVMADFIGNTNGNVSPSIGVVRKHCTRSLLYSGSWSIAQDSNSPSGFETYTASDGSYVEYTFWGTGIEHNQYMASSARNYTYSIDGSTDLSGFTTNFYNSAIGSMTFNPATGVLSGTPASGTYGALLSIRDLPLGKHTIRVTKNSGGDMYADAFDVITPIHINSPDFSLDQLSLLDKRVDELVEDTSKKIDLSRAKAWVVFNGLSGEEKIYGAYNVSAILRVGAGQWAVYFKKAFKNTGYVVSGSSDGSNYFCGPFHPSSDTTAKQTNYCKVFSYNASGTSEDERHICVIVHGELEDEENINLEDL